MSNVGASKKKIDSLIITNLPSFYKINLYNRINTKIKIFVVFTGDTADIRNNDFFKGKREFDYTYLEGGSNLRKALQVIRILKDFDYKRLILGGWDSLSMWVSLIYSPKNKNAVVIESSYLESDISGIKGLLKKLFMKKVSTVYASGKGQKILAEKLGFTGIMIITKGVGLFNIINQPEFVTKSKVENFIYVGRLSPEKNLKYLIDTFNRLSDLTLHIIGFGPLEADLRAIAGPNVILHGTIENKFLPKYYQANDVFILPSLTEPWGLVVEEAFNNGIPVVVSDRVGCAEEIVKPDENGIVFSLSENDNLRNAILKMTEVDYYNNLRKNISQMDFNKIIEEQVSCYLK